MYDGAVKQLFAKPCSLCGEFTKYYFIEGGAVVCEECDYFDDLDYDYDDAYEYDEDEDDY